MYNQMQGKLKSCANKPSHHFLLPHSTLILPFSSTATFGPARDYAKVRTRRCRERRSRPNCNSRQILEITLDNLKRGENSLRTGTRGWWVKQKLRFAVFRYTRAVRRAARQMYQTTENGCSDSVDSMSEQTAWQRHQRSKRQDDLVLERQTLSSIKMCRGGFPKY